jgi:hypothetical protein
MKNSTRSVSNSWLAGTRARSSAKVISSTPIGFSRVFAKRVSRRTFRGWGTNHPFNAPMARVRDFYHQLHGDDLAEMP